MTVYMCILENIVLENCEKSIGGAGRGGGQTINRSQIARPDITISESDGVLVYN